MKIIFEYLVACGFFAIVAFCIFFVLSIREVRLGLFHRQGTVGEWTEKLQVELGRRGAKIKAIDAGKGKIEVEGIVAIVRAMLEINTRYGDTIVFSIAQSSPDEVAIDVIGKRSWSSRMSYTKKEIAENEYNLERVENIMAAI